MLNGNIPLFPASVTQTTTEQRTITSGPQNFTYTITWVPCKLFLSLTFDLFRDVCFVVFQSTTAQTTMADATEAMPAA